MTKKAIVLGLIFALFLPVGRVLAMAYVPNGAPADPTGMANSPQLTTQSLSPASGYVPGQQAIPYQGVQTGNYLSAGGYPISGNFGFGAAMPGSAMVRERSGFAFWFFIMIAVTAVLIWIFLLLGIVALFLWLKKYKPR